MKVLSIANAQLEQKAQKGSLALIETITLAEDVNAVIPANIGSNQYDEIWVDIAGTASVDTPTLNLTYGASDIVAQLSLSFMTLTRYIRVFITRVSPGSAEYRVSCGHSNSRATSTSENGTLVSGSIAHGISGFKFALNSTNVWKAGGVFRIWGRKWAQ